MITTKIAKFAAIATLSTGLVLAGTAESRAGNENLLIGGLLGGAAGAGAGYAFGQGKGAVIGGIMGLALGAVLSNHFAGDRTDAAEPAYTGYVPPPPPAYQPSPYQPPVYESPTYGYQTGPVDPYAPTYQGVAYRPAPVYAQAVPSQAVCRQYTTSIRIDGKRHPSHGTACLQADGIWKTMN